MLSTPRALRLHIGLFGRRNAGKSALVNALAGQAVALVSAQPGTTTDPVAKAMELGPLGPVCLLDTAGIDDVGPLGSLRADRTREVLGQVDLALLVTDRGAWGPWEDTLRSELEALRIPFLAVRTKVDLGGMAELPEGVAGCDVASLDGRGVEQLRAALAALPARLEEPPLLLDLVPPGELAVLVMPIDAGAPRGRLILPQAMAVRELLDGRRLSLVVQPGELAAALDRLCRPPALVVTDSQAFRAVAAAVPEGVPLTSFSILLARARGDLEAQVRGLRALDGLRDGDRVLIAEGCSHHPSAEDIGRIKLPRWLAARTGRQLRIEHVQGRDFPAALEGLALVVHCGHCMGTRREMQARLRACAAAGVPATNYGLAIAAAEGTLDRALLPFPAARAALQATHA